jgi:ABC-type sugar transport system permease subunit
LALSRPQRALLAAPFVVLVAAGLILPLVGGLLATLTNFAPRVAAVAFVGVANYVAVLRNAAFDASLRNIVVITVVAVPLEIAIGLLLASGLRRPFRGRGIVRVLLLLPWVISPVAIGVMWHFLLGGNTSALSFVSELVGGPAIQSPLTIKGFALPVVILIEVWRGAALATFLLAPAVASVPDERWDQAALDGLGRIGRLVRVVVPTIRSHLLGVALLLVAATLGTFDTILILTSGGPGSDTLTPALFSYQEAYQFSNWPLGATAAWIECALVAVAAAAYLFLSRRAEVEAEADA